MPQGECPHSFSAIQALGLVFSHREKVPFLHEVQRPHEMGNGTTTRSPIARFFTAEPSSTTSPMNSCPRMSPFSMEGMKPLNRWMSEPQIAVEVTFTIASCAFKILGSGTFS